MKRFLAGRYSFLLPAGAFALLLLVVYADPVFFRRNFGGRDLTAYNLPMEFAIHDAYARGRFPVWMTDVSGGRPLSPNPNSGALYPVRMLLAPLPFALAMRIFPVLHWFVAGIGIMLLLGTLGVSRGGAWIAAATAVFSGVSVTEMYFPHIQPGFTCLPWILWALIREGRTRGRRILILSIPLALVMLAGDIFTISLAILCCLIWIAVEMEPPHQRTRLLDLGGALVLATLASLPQIVATALWIPETNRAVFGMKLSEAFLFSVPPLRLFELIVPFPFGPTWALEPSRIWGTPLFRGREVGYFSTLHCGAFAVVAFLATWSQKRPGIRFARATLALGLALSVLPSFLPSAWGEWHAPLALRHPEKLVVAVVLGLSLLSGFAFDRLRQRWSGDGGVLAIGAVLLVFAAISEVWGGAAGAVVTRLVGAEPALAGVAGADLPRALIEGGMIWVATFLALRLLVRGRTQVAALALLTALPVLSNRRIARTFRAEEIFAPTAFAQLQLRIDPQGRFRALGESMYQPTSPLDEAAASVERRDWSEYTQTLWKRGTVFNLDFDSGDLARVESLRRISVRAASYRDSSRFFESFCLRWGIRYRDQRALAGYRRIGGDILQDWDENTAALPDIRLTTAWREEPDATSAARALPLLAPGEIVLETGRRGSGRSASGGVDVLERSPERLVLRARSPDPAWLFVLRDFWESRSISIDGREVECVPAQLAFSAVFVPGGEHRVVWEERMPGSQFSVWGPVLFILLSAFLIVRPEPPRSQGSVA